MNKLYGNPTRAPFNDSPTFFVFFFFYYFCKGLSSLPSSSNPELFLQAASPPPPPSLTIINFCLGCCSLSTPTPPLTLLNDDAARPGQQGLGSSPYCIEELNRGRPPSFPLCVHSPACLQFPFHHHIVGCATYACMQQCIQQNRKPRRRRRRTHATNKPPPPIVITRQQQQQQMQPRLTLKVIIIIITCNVWCCECFGAKMHQKHHLCYYIYAYCTGYDADACWSGYDGECSR